jgi:glycogen(starch) synthase
MALPEGFPQMKVLLQTRFHPSIGGIETLAEILANEWVGAGVEVVVSTDVSCPPGRRRSFSYPVYHAASWRELFRLVRHADIVAQMNVSLKTIWPVAFAKSRFIAIHNGCYFVSPDRRRDWRQRLKLALARRASANIAVSNSVMRDIGIECEVIPNAYNNDIFTTPPNDVARPRPLELVFVGRLVAGKGIDTLLTALAFLSPALTPRLTIIGDGPERHWLEKRAEVLGIAEQVRFTGACDQTEVAELLRQHEILVVPSLWEEAFGIVALEGAGCGCLAVGADTGGLPEAIGPAGLIFRGGDARDLAAKLRMLLRDPDQADSIRNATPAHLAMHQPAVVAARYLEIFRSVVKK